MQNAKKIMIAVGSVCCLLSASFANAQPSFQPVLKSDTGSIQVAVTDASLSYATHKSSLSVAARFNFEHVRFEFIQVVNDTTLQKPSKRKRVAFSNLV